MLSERGVHILSDECVPSGLVECALFIERDGEWKKSDDGRVYGQARVRFGVKRSPYMRQGTASWYAYKRCRCAASPDFPKGTRLRVRSVADPKKYTVIRVNDWGPDRKRHPERVIDLDKVAFMELAPKGAGLIKVTVEPVLPSDPEYDLADRMPAVFKKTVTNVAPTKIEPAQWSY